MPQSYLKSFSFGCFYALVLLVVIVSAILFFSSSVRESSAHTLWRSFNFFYPSLLLTRDADLAVAIGDYYFNGSGGYDLNRAVLAYKTAEKIEPENNDIRYKLSRTLFVKKDPDALLNINKVILADPTFSRARYLRGLIYADQGKYTLAEKDFRDFIEQAPHGWGGYNDLAWVLLFQDKFKEAETVARQGLALFGDNLWLLNNLGVALLGQGKTIEARDVLKETKISLEKNPFSLWRAAYSGNSMEEIYQLRKEFEEQLDKNISRAMDTTN